MPLWAILLIVGAGLIGLAALYLHFWYSRPVGSGPAGPAVSAEKFDFHWTDRPVLLVGIGDSVTAGYGASPGKGYFQRLAKNPPDEFADMHEKSLAEVFPNLTVSNLALSGSTSQECLDLLVPKLKTQDEDTFGVIVITTGGNDIIHNYGRTPPRECAMYGATLEQARPWIENFRVRLDEILNEIQARFPGGCEFFIANIYDPTDGLGDATTAGLPAWPDGLEIIRAYNEIIQHAAAARKNVELVDMHAGFLGHGVHCTQFWRSFYDQRDPHYWYWENLEDPNDRGYDALRRMFLNEMARVLPSLLEDGD
ncbi:MAG: SGNH/GDSL hydrolase family protein [Planctomycetes bacterium]|nr:SGNH/GDSL hydrolase family protein [Planctomycetota bacterium]